MSLVDISATGFFIVLNIFIIVFSQYLSVLAEPPSIFLAEMKEERSSEFAFRVDSSDVTEVIMSRPFRLLINNSLRFSH